MSRLPHLIILLLISAAGYYVSNHPNLFPNASASQQTATPSVVSQNSAPDASPAVVASAPGHTMQEAVDYLRANHRLPEYYLTKSAAATRGWRPASGNLCDVAPGMMIGGDVFTNTQHLLPTAAGRVWHEADFNYHCGNRNADRILYSSDGLIYITIDHYKTVNPAP